MAYLDDVREDLIKFDADVYLCQRAAELLPDVDPRAALSDSRARRLITRLDPLAFALVYFPHHVRLRADEFDDDEDGPVTLTRMHVEVCQIAREWVHPRAHRDAVIGPRNVGKSTWVFLLLPMWALAHRHRTFAIAFADNANMAMQHLITFKAELDANEMLRKDYPGLCEPRRRSSGASVADRRDLYVSKNDQIFRAAGIDSTNLGAKIGNDRPDLIIFDDVEPGASNYSDYQKDQRLASIVNEVFPMNRRAAIIFAGTVFMAGSIMHDLVRVAMARATWDNIAGVSVGAETGEEDDWPHWVDEQRISPHYYPAMWFDENGEPCSIWPQFWPAHEWLQGTPTPEYRTAAFQVSMQNNPRGRDDGWWKEEDFHHEELEGWTRCFLQIDPAVTDHKRSDYTGLTVNRWKPARGRDVPRVEIAYADRVKLIGERLRQRVLKILSWFPEISAIFVESNLGGELWKQALHGMPVPVLTRYSDLPKEVRIARALDWYQRPGKRVVHSNQACAKLELDMIAYPNLKHDDLVDCAALGILRCLGYDQQQRKRVRVHQASYIARY